MTQQREEHLVGAAPLAPPTASFVQHWFVDDDDADATFLIKITFKLYRKKKRFFSILMKMMRK